MNYRRLLLSVLCAGTIITNVTAATEVKIEDRKVTVTCDAPLGKSTAMTAVRKNHSLSEKDWIVAVKESAERDGKAVFTFKMPDAVNSESIDGEYVVYTKSEGKTSENVEFLYVSPATVTRVKGLLSGVASADDLVAIFADGSNEFALEFMGYDIASYNALTGPFQTKTCQAMFESVVDFSVAEDADLTSAFAKALVVNYINSASTAENVGNVIGSFTFEDVSYDSIADSNLKAWITDNIFNHKPYAGYDNIVKEYKVANILYTINGARFSSIKALLEKYATDLGIANHPTYLAYKGKAGDGPLNEKIATRLGEKRPNTATQLMDEINDVMNPSSPPSGGGGGGSAGGGGGGASPSKPSGGNYEEGTASKPTLVLPVEKVSQDKESIFADVSVDFWGADAIKTLVKNKIVSGDGDGTFRPNDRISREEFIKMAVSILGNVNENAVCAFDDVKENDWYYKYVATAVDAGIIYGVSDTMFGSGQGLTRQDMAVICARAFGDKIKTIRDDVAFSDESNIESYAKEAVHKLYTSGVISGMDDNSFAPDAFATRAQAAQILYKLFYN